MNKNIVLISMFVFVGLMLNYHSLIAKNYVHNHYFDYHKYINKAEISIVTTHYDKALFYYDSAFKIVTYPLAKDLYNALMLCIIENKKDKVFELANSLALKGIGAKFFLKNKEFEKVKKNKDKWKEIIQTAKTAKNNLKIKNKIIFQQIDSLLLKSENAHKEWQYALNSNDIHLRLNATSQMISCGICLKRIFNKYGYLSEEIIGVNLRNDMTINILPIFSPIIENELKAYIPNLYDDTTYNSYLYPALFEVKIDPQVFAYFQNYDIQIELGIQSYFVLDNILYSNKIYKSDSINKKRKEYYICKLSDSEIKSNFLLCNPNTSFIINEFSFYNDYPSYKEIKEDIITHIGRYNILKKPFPKCTNL